MTPKDQAIKIIKNELERFSEEDIIKSWQGSSDYLIHKGKIKIKEYNGKELKIQQSFSIKALIKEIKNKQDE